MRQIDTIVIHCSATPADRDIGRAEIDHWHRDKGWSGIGYHFVLRRDGTRETGRPVEQVGSHAQGHNARSIGICLVGGVAKAGDVRGVENFTATQWTALRLLVVQLRKRYPNARIVGHRDLNRGKDCPSFSVRDWLQSEGIDNPVAPTPKPLRQSKTLQGATLTSTGVAGTSALEMGAELTETGQSLSFLSEYSDTLKLLFIGLIVAGVGVTFYGRLRLRSEAGV